MHNQVEGKDIQPNSVPTNTGKVLFYTISCLSLSSFIFINSIPCLSSSFSFLIVFFIFLSLSLLLHDYSSLPPITLT